jgi:tungstate transport system permease protein
MRDTWQRDGEMETLRELFTQNSIILSRHFEHMAQFARRPRWRSCGGAGTRRAMHDIGQAILAALALIARLDRELTEIVALSLRVSLSATFIAMIIGAVLGGLLAVSRFPGQQGAVVLANALLGLPPVVVGLLIYLILSRSGPLGFAGLLFTPTAMVFAQVVLTTPIVVALVHRATTVLWSEYGDVLQVDGASKARIIRELFIIGRGALLTAFLAAFGRAIAEVGAIIIVGGNIRGYTRTMTTAIALETSKGELALALGLGLILITLSVMVSAVAFLLNSWARKE